MLRPGLVLMMAAFAGAGSAQVARSRPEKAIISSAVWVGDTLYLSGTMAPVDYPADRAKGLPAGYRGDTKAQAIGSIKAIEVVLKGQGLTLGDVVQMQAFLAGDPAKGGVMDLEGWNAAYNQFFGTAEQPNKPVRATVQVARLVIPTGMIELMVVAARSHAGGAGERFESEERVGLSNLLKVETGADMQIGIDSFAAVQPGANAAERMGRLVEEIVRADEVGLDHFGLGEHHRAEFLDSAPAVILAAGAARTKTIRLTSAVTVLSAADPVRVFQEFATLDLLSGGRAEMVVGRGSFIESFPLFGLDTRDYDSLFASKLDLLMTIREQTHVTWNGKHRAALTGQAVYPRPLQEKIPIWLGVGGTPESFARAGALGLPLMVAIIGGEPHRFRPLIDLYYEAGSRAGFARDTLKVGVHALGYVGETDVSAADDFFPGYAEAFTKIGRERGWPPVTRRQFDALLGPTGALMVGSAETVARKVLAMSEALGGVARVSFQMSVAELPHEKMLRGIELLGVVAAPKMRELAAAAL